MRKWRVRCPYLELSLLKLNPTLFVQMQDYVTSHFHVEESSSDSSRGEKTEGVDATIDDVVSFIMARKSGNPRFRGPMLALIELRTRLVAKRSSGASDGKKNIYTH